MKTALFPALVAIFVSAIFPSSAQANCAREFRAVGRQIPAALLKLGKTKYGRLRLKQLVAGIESVQVIPATKEEINRRNGNTGNTTARWEVSGDQRRIFVDCAWWQQYPENKSVFSLHEFLGVFGFHDRDFWLSTSLWYSTQPELDYLRQEEKAKIEKWIIANANAVSRSGGVVGVGGGGETVNAYARTHLLKLYSKQLREARSSRERQEALESIYRQLSSNSFWSAR